TVDGLDHWLPAALGRAERVPPLLEVVGGLREELRDVAARAERGPAGAADDHHADGVVRLQVAEELRQLVSHRHRDRVHLGGTVDPDRRPRPLPLHAPTVAHDRISVYWPSRSSRRRILPDGVLGISRTKTMRRGRLKLASAALSRQ